MNTGGRRARKVVREMRREAREGELNVVSLIDVFAILVFYLLVNALVVEILPSPRALQLPESVAQEQPQQAVLILVTSEGILVDSKLVMSTQDAAGMSGSILPELKYRLNEEALIPVADGKPGEVTRGEVNIMADRSIPFHVIRKIMATCSDTRFARISLAVLEKNGGDQE